MPVGKLIYRLRSKYRHGLRAAYYRDIVRWRIVNSPPVTGLNDDRCEIHVLTSQQDWLNLLWCLKSFYFHSGRCYQLCIHDDGSLSDEAKSVLARHFPDSRLIERARAEEEVFGSLASYPKCAAFRRSNHLAPKLFDFLHYLHAERMLLLDSDVLFFGFPKALIDRIEDPKYLLNTVNADIASAYTVDPMVVRQRCGFDLIARFNSGLGLIHKASLQLSWLEEFLELPGVLGHFWRIEQTLFALCSSRHGVELLPSEYDVFLNGARTTQPVRHYVGRIRHLMYSEGLPLLLRQELLKCKRR